MLKLIDRQTLVDIADAIRQCNDSSETYHPSEMADAIRALARFGAPIPIYGLFDTGITTSATAIAYTQSSDSVALSEFKYQDMYDITATASLK